MPNFQRLHKVTAEAVHHLNFFLRDSSLPSGTPLHIQKAVLDFHRTNTT
uniref:Uncharacterized protein n=1 Tax=Anguilla anguilla TaxID=7936 RepID=A0A0E9SA97_ANGAN